jgi:cytochrome c biogenesis factor
MLAEIGLLALGIGTLATLYSLITAYLGARRASGGVLLLESSRKAALVTCGLLTLASLIVVYLLASLDFSVQYVWEVSSA